MPRKQASRANATQGITKGITKGTFLIYHIICGMSRACRLILFIKLEIKQESKTTCGGAMESLLNRIAREQNKQEWVEFDSELFNKVLSTFKYLSRERNVIEFGAVEEFYFILKEQIQDQKESRRIRIYDDGAVFCDGKRVENLTHIERSLICALKRRNTASIEMLAEVVWGDPDKSRNSIYCLICQLNKKIARAGLPFLIQYKRGTGYKIQFWKPCNTER